jgi:hypothetical protein
MYLSWHTLPPESIHVNREELSIPISSPASAALTPKLRDLIASRVPQVRPIRSTGLHSLLTTPIMQGNPDFGTHIHIVSVASEWTSAMYKIFSASAEQGDFFQRALPSGILLEDFLADQGLRTPIRQLIVSPGIPTPLIHLGYPGKMVAIGALQFMNEDQGSIQ